MSERVTHKHTPVNNKYGSNSVYFMYTVNTQTWNLYKTDRKQDDIVVNIYVHFIGYTIQHACYFHYMWYDENLGDKMSTHTWWHSKQLTKSCAEKLFKAAFRFGFDQFSNAQHKCLLTI